MEKFNCNELVAEMKNGNINSLKYGFCSQSSIYRMNAIFWTVKNHIYDENLISKIKYLKSDNTRMNGFSVGEFALAGLDILNVEKYQGDNISVKNLIKSNFDF